MAYRERHAYTNNAGGERVPKLLATNWRRVPCAYGIGFLHSPAGKESG
jgi:hypothetical protein